MGTMVPKGYEGKGIKRGRTVGVGKRKRAVFCRKRDGYKGVGDAEEGEDNRELLIKRDREEQRRIR